MDIVKRANECLPQRKMRRVVAAAAGLLVLVGAAWADGSTLYVVSQRGTKFQPGAMTIARGDTLQIVNDDGDILHHAYIDADGFSFDSGDQEPGSKTNVVFTKSGVFTMLCGIHPKMKMLVTVKE
jgi:plastocyanin